VEDFGVEECLLKPAESLCVVDEDRDCCLNGFGLDVGLLLRLEARKRVLMLDPNQSGRIFDEMGIVMRE
jgi:hypothetical protein